MTLFREDHFSIVPLPLTITIPPVIKPAPTFKIRPETCLLLILPYTINPTSRITYYIHTFQLKQLVTHCKRIPIVPMY